MNSKIISNGILRALAIIIGVFALLYFLYEIQSVLVYIAIAAVISLIGRPIVAFLKSKLKFKNTIAVITTMVILIGLLIGLVRMFIPLIVEQGHNLSLLNIEQLQSNVEDLYYQLTDYFSISTSDVQESLKESKLLSKLDYSIIPDFLNSVVSGFGSFSIGLFSVLFIAFFFLKDSQLFEQGILVLVPDTKEAKSKKSFNANINAAKPDADEASPAAVGILFLVSMINGIC